MTKQRRKGFLCSYRDTILSALFIFGIGVYPSIAMHFNPPPALEQTEKIHGVIVHAQREHSHILLELPDGRVQPLDFPGDLQGAYPGMWRAFSGATNQEFLTLKGCIADIRVDHLRGLGIQTNPRIWDLRCDRFSISYQKLVKYYYSSTDHRITTFLFWFTIFAALALVIRNDINRRSREI
jgi:hypothetical protein